MGERFQTFFTRLRPHRVAVLTNVNDPMWESTCMSIIEYLSQVWGGYQSLIIPTDGTTIDPLFWKVLSAFDPDIINYYVRSLHDVKRWAPDEAEKMLETELQRVKANNPSHLLPDDVDLRGDIMRRQPDSFSISPDLTKELLLRLSPFHSRGHYIIKPIRMGNKPIYPLTKVADVAPFVPSPDALFVFNNNLPSSRESPPPLWIHAQSGIGSDQLQKDLAAIGVATIPKHMNVETDSGILDWGIIPEVSFGQHALFGLSCIGLASVKASAAQSLDTSNLSR